MIAVETYECNRCGVERPIEEFDRQKSGRRKVCKHCRNDDRRSRYARSEEARAAHRKEVRKHRLKSRYGITPEQYDEMLLAQNGVCAICENECPKNSELSVDHDHDSGLVRGLLCDPCNRLLACARDSTVTLERAIEYLEAF